MRGGCGGSSWSAAQFAHGLRSTLCRRAVCSWTVTSDNRVGRSSPPSIASRSSSEAAGWGTSTARSTSTSVAPSRSSCSVPSTPRTASSPSAFCARRAPRTSSVTPTSSTSSTSAGGRRSAVHRPGAPRRRGPRAPRRRAAAACFRSTSVCELAPARHRRGRRGARARRRAPRHQAGERLPREAGGEVATPKLLDFGISKVRAPDRARHRGRA